MRGDRSTSCDTHALVPFCTEHGAPSPSFTRENCGYTRPTSRGRRQPLLYLELSKSWKSHVWVVREPNRTEPGQRELDPGLETTRTFTSNKPNSTELPPDGSLDWILRRETPYEPCRVTDLHERSNQCRSGYLILLYDGCACDSSIQNFCEISGRFIREGEGMT